ncbi:MAG: DUF1800 family protein [Deltaproteobacteria bacterium]
MKNKMMTHMIWLCSFALIGQHSFGMSEAQFESTLRAALKRSRLNPAEKAQHVLNRLAYGPNPSQPVNLLKYKTVRGQQVYDVEATDEAIINYITDSVKPGMGLTNDVQAKAEGLFHYLTLNADEIRARYKVHRDAVMAAKDRLDNPQPGDDLRRLRAELESTTRDLVLFRNTLIESLAAEQAVHALLENKPFNMILFDFWFNHFNTSAEKSWLHLKDYIELIRANMYGTFSDFVTAVAKSPQMLIYLDNVRNKKPGYTVTDKNGITHTYGPNENYGRELIELHTTGRVESKGYTLKDVQQASLAMTGWTYSGKTNAFVFVAREHDTTPKTVMGHSLPENGGQAEGEELIRFLSNRWNTAMNISKKLILTFAFDRTGDEKIQALFDGLRNKMKDDFLASRGDLKSLYFTLLASEEFWSSTAYRAKIGRPFDQLVRLYRMSGISLTTIAATDIKAVNSRDGLLDRSKLLGQHLLKCTPPTGYPANSGSWINTGSVISMVKTGFEVAAYRGNPNQDVYGQQTFSEIDGATISFRNPGPITEHIFRLKHIEDRYGLGVELKNIPATFSSNKWDRDWHPESRSYSYSPITTTLGFLLGTGDFYRK